MRRLSSLAAMCTVFAVTPLAAQASRIRVTPQGDSLLVVRLGPVRLAANAEHHDVSQLALQTWRMPAGGWLRGYKVEMVDRRGNALPSVLIHHAEMVDLDRRDLLRPALNRVVSAGKETSQLLLPLGMGYPVEARQQLGINAMLANPTATAYPEAYVQATITLIAPGTANVRNVMSFYAETSFDSTGNSDFDLPAGTSAKVVQFAVPIAGEVLAVGGHIHDYGTRFTVVRGGLTDTIYNATPRVDSTGAVLGMPTLPMFGRTVRIAPGDAFVMTVNYNNPTGRLLEGAGMGTFGVVFAPDDLTQWPALDRADPKVQHDLADLRSPHQRVMRQGTQMQGGHHH